VFDPSECFFAAECHHWCKGEAFATRDTRMRPGSNWTSDLLNGCRLFQPKITIIVCRSKYKLVEVMKRRPDWFLLSFPRFWIYLLIAPEVDEGMERLIRRKRQTYTSSERKSIK
jgi:hypothetical protein